jgi:hypothetical protein
LDSGNTKLKMLYINLLLQINLIYLCYTNTIELRNNL